MTKLVLLDVDGVLAPLEATDAPSFLVEGDWSNWRVLDSAAEWLCNLATKEGVEIRWATMWEDRAAPIAEALELDLDYESFPEPVDPGVWLKNERVLTLLEEGIYEKIVWVDDEHDVYSQGLAEQFEALELISVSGDRGLSFRDALDAHVALGVAP